MKYFSIVIATMLLLISFSLVAQENTQLIDQDKERFEKNVFNKEFGDEEDTIDVERKLLDKIPEKLPDWVFQPIVKSEKIRVVGFSDPNMDKNLAYQQAVMRAKAIYALLDLSLVSNITDDYTNMKESGKYALYSTKFQDFALSKSQFVYNKEAIQLVDTFYTKYNEGIVLIEIDRNKNDSVAMDTLIVRGEHLQVFIERNFQKERVEFFNLFSQEKTADDSLDVHSQYNYKIVNRSYDINSNFGTRKIEFQVRTYNYRTNLEFVKDSTSIESREYRLNKGLWNAYLTGLLSNITVLSKLLASQVKNSNDFYTLKNEGLIRTVARNKVSFGFNDFKMYQNQFYIDLNGIIIQ